MTRLYENLPDHELERGNDGSCHLKSISSIAVEFDDAAVAPAGSTRVGYSGETFLGQVQVDLLRKRKNK